MVRKETGILLVVLADLTCDPFLLDFWKNILYIRRSVIERFYLECFAYNYTIGSSIISIHWIINAIRLMKTIRKRSRYCDQRLAFCSLRIQPFLLAPHRYWRFARRNARLRLSDRKFHADDVKSVRNLVRIELSLVIVVVILFYLLFTNNRQKAKGHKDHL